MRKLIVVTAAAAMLTLASAAQAHVTVSPAAAAKGSFAKLAFSVPNERDEAKTVKVEVNFPENAPVPFVSVRPVPGWTVSVEKRHLDAPVTAHGTPISDVVSKVTWSGGAIGAGEFQIFEVSAGPLPESVSSMLFPALQTYDNGEVVRWIEPTPATGDEPEHPAPKLTLTAAPADEHAASADDDDSGSGVATGIAVAALLVALAAGAVALRPRRS
jgi:uncharacterized protein YcnI